MVGDTLGVGTFYDFTRRLWIAEENSLSDPVHPPKTKLKRPSKKGEKADPVEKVTVYDLLTSFELEPPQDFAPAGRLFEIFKSQFLNKSVDEGLIDLENLAVSGDGTPVYTGARERKTRTCDCLVKGIRDCKCNRIYHYPDCSIGWDSHRDHYYFGYDLYMLTASDSESDLPIFPLWGQLPGMIPMAFYTTISPCCSSSRKPMSANFSWILPMMPWLTMNTVAIMVANLS